MCDTINFGIRPPSGKMLTITVIKKQSKANETLIALTCNVIVGFACL